MKNFSIGVILATVAMYMWGFLYWGGANPFPYKAWKQSKDDVAAGKALLEHFPETGTYYLPGMNHEQSTREQLFQNGPVAFVHITARDGCPMMDPSIMVKGFFVNLIVVVLFALLLKCVAGALPSYWDRVKFAVLTGLMAAVLIDFGDAVWWRIPWEWKIQVALYNFSAIFVAGLVLAKFVSVDRE